jgi:hypothetical protein
MCSYKCHRTCFFYLLRQVQYISWGLSLNKCLSVFSFTPLLSQRKDHYSSPEPHHIEAMILQPKYAYIKLTIICFWGGGRHVLESATLSDMVITKMIITRRDLKLNADSELQGGRGLLFFILQVSDLHGFELHNYVDTPIHKYLFLI